MATFGDLNAEEQREYVEQGIKYFSTLKRAISDGYIVKREALADGDNEVVAQAAADRRVARRVNTAGSIPTYGSVISDIAAQRALEPSQ